VLGEFRTQQGVSLETVARQIGMTVQELDALENNPESEICPDMVKHIASAIEGP
jgi:transcriptional regulator with XRE-family HTH domain